VSQLTHAERPHGLASAPYRPGEHHHRFAHDHGDERAHGEHGHSHGLVDRSILRSRAGIRAVLSSLGVLGFTAAAQAAVFLFTGSVALLADLIHNAGDALTALPVGVAFTLRSARAERWAGLAVVAAIFISACVALYETILRLIDPQELSHLSVLAGAGIVGYVGNEVAARIRLRAGRRLESPALVADGNHARVDAFVSLGVVASAAAVAAGLPIADPIIGLGITAVILKITRDSWRTVRTRPDGEPAHPASPSRFGDPPRG
jgi:cation diffusion facilitator family transporter